MFSYPTSELSKLHVPSFVRTLGIKKHISLCELKETICIACFSCKVTLSRKRTVMHEMQLVRYHVKPEA